MLKEVPFSFDPLTQTPTAIAALKHLTTAIENQSGLALVFRDKKVN